MNSIWLTMRQKTFKASQRQSMYVNDQFSYGSLSNIYMHASFIKKTSIYRTTHSTSKQTPASINPGQRILHRSRCQLVKNFKCVVHLIGNFSNQHEQCFFNSLHVCYSLLVTSKHAKTMLLPYSSKSKVLIPRFPEFKIYMTKYFISSFVCYLSVE